MIWEESKCGKQLEESSKNVAVKDDGLKIM